MRHNYVLEGRAFRLRPVETSDAQTIIDIRLEDARRNKFINKVSPDVNEQVKWLNNYFENGNGVYFAVENKKTGETEGFIRIYDYAGGRAEWGSLVVKKGSLAIPETVYLIINFAFSTLGLTELFGIVLNGNKASQKLHDKLGEPRRRVIKNYITIGGETFDATEVYITPEIFETVSRPVLERIINDVSEFCERDGGLCS